MSSASGAGALSPILAGGGLRAPHRHRPPEVPPRERRGRTSRGRRGIAVPPFDIERIPAAERFDSAALVAALRQTSRPADLCSTADAVMAALASRPERDTVVLIISKGACDKIHEKLRWALREPLHCLPGHQS